MVDFAIRRYEFEHYLKQSRGSWPVRGPQTAMGCGCLWQIKIYLGVKFWVCQDEHQELLERISVVRESRLRPAVVSTRLQNDLPDVESSRALRSWQQW